MINCLLVEPAYKTKYPNVALMKLSTKLKQEGKNVEYYKGLRHPVLTHTYDEIYITTLFTYEAKKTIATIKHYQQTFPEAKIVIGGIFASLMPDYIEEQTGIKPFIGYSKELDQLKPDYDLIKTGSKWDKYSFVFTSRGCVNQCPYCAVPIIEPGNWINPEWKKQVSFDRINISIQDNNLTALPIEHFREVMMFCKKYKLRVIIESGLDCRLFNDEHVKALKSVRLLPRGLRFAFDHMGQEGYIQRTIKTCLENEIKPTQLMVYVLFNFNDTPLEAEYRCRELIKLGIIPYPQRYVPLNKITRHPEYVGEHWSSSLVSLFRQYYQPQRQLTFKKQTFPKWLENTGSSLINDFYKQDWEPPTDLDN